MYGSLPPEQDNIRQRLIEQWIRDQPTMDSKIEGCATIISAFYDALRLMIGEVALRAVLSRAATLARWGNPLLSDLVVTLRGIDVDCLREKLQGESPEVAQAALSELVNKLFVVLYELLGRALMPVLRDVEAELAAKGAAPPREEDHD